jgi:signal transduction histidine kinase/ActR/RegA family two-component response regulator
MTERMSLQAGPGTADREQRSRDHRTSSGGERRVVASRRVRALLLTPDEECARALATLAAHSRWVRFDLGCVDSIAVLRTAVERQEYDVILIDALAIAAGDADLVSELRQRECSPPVILLKTGAHDDIEDRRRGAADCLPKVGLSATALESSILLVLQRRRTEMVVNAVARAQATVQTREVEVEALRSQLCQAQKTDALGRIASGIVHDFNNVLGAIDGYTELMKMSFDPEDSRRADLEEIHGASVRGRDLTRQLLSFVRREPHTPALTDLNAAVAAVTRMFRRLIPERIELTTRCEPSPAGITIDRARCEQLLLNLLINARDAIPAHGRISIETSTEPGDAAATAKSQGRVHRRYVKLTVSDTGVGMDDSIRARLFEPFFTTKGEAGTGLGLAVVKSVVQDAEGQVLVSSSVGVGSTFTVLLPCGDEQPVGNGASAEDAEAPRAAVILLVEDRPALRDAYARVLRLDGHTVFEARDGLEALQVHRENQVEPDVLITDLRMPRLGGRELANALRFVRPSLQVVFTSGYPATAATEMPGIGPSAEFLEKPFSAERLVGVVRGLLHRRTLESIPVLGTPALH